MRSGRCWHQPGMALAGVCLLLGLYAVPAAARQYRTHVRVVPNSQTQSNSSKNLQQRVQTLQGKPYAQAMTLRQLAGQAANQGDLGKARQALQHALDLGALSALAQEEIRANLAQLYAAAGKPRKVIATLAPLIKQGVPADAINSKAWLALGMAYVKLGEWDKAVAPMRRASTGNAVSKETLYQLKLAVYMHASRYADAADALHQLIAIDPNNAEYLLQLAAVASKRHNYDATVAALEVALRRAMLKTDAQRLQLVRAYMASGAPYDAATQLAAWLEDGQLPKNASNWQLLATTWIHARETARAIKPLQHAARLTGDARLYAQLGQLQMDLAHWAAAAKAFKQALSRGGTANTGAILLSLGLAYYQQSKTGAALKAFRRAQGQSQVADLAKKWVQFLNAKPPSLQPMEMQGLAGSGVAGTAVTATSMAARSAQRKQAILNKTPASVPATDDMLTPVGAVRMGNVDATIPPWTGGITSKRAPASYTPGGPLVDPFANEQPLFTITRANLDQYKDLLSAGEKALFAHYADYSMPVYPSHRTAAYPTAIYRATLANQDMAHLQDPDALTGAKLGFPFRKPHNGVEVMWNHRLRYRGSDILSRSDGAVVGNTGVAKMQRRTEKILFGYGNPHKPEDMPANILAYYMMSLNHDGRQGITVLVHETMDNRRTPRRIWVAVPKAQRVLRLPPVGYDNPLPGTRSMLFVDQIDMYNGLFDHYVWKLVGRREMIVPYNAYRLQSKHISYDQLLQPHFPARKPMRYERHRVWIVEATTRPGDKNQFGRRVFYVDEDTWSILMVDCYDNDGNLWRFQEGHPVQYYGVQAMFTGPVFIFDFKSGRYYATRLTNQAPGVSFNTNQFRVGEFRPSTLRRNLN